MPLTYIVVTLCLLLNMALWGAWHEYTNATICFAALMIVVAMSEGN